jgi:cytochrome b561
LTNSDSANRYTTTASALHWLIAAGVITQIALGWWMQSIPKIPPGSRLAAFNLHKSIGISIFLLMLVRIAWRATHRPPALPPMPQWQARAARINHALLYACLVIMPLAGFTASSFSGRPIVYFGHPLPLWFLKNDSISDVFYGIHFVTSCVLVAAIVVHILAAMKHQLVDRDGLMRRIWPWRYAHAASLGDIAE